MNKNPNVIIVLCDDLGYGDLGYLGSNVNRSPNIDSMARRSINFDNFYAAPLCSPSRAALMSGCYPSRVGLERGYNFPVLLPGDCIGMNVDEHILPKHFKKNGYKTGIIGKWHLGDQPEFMPRSQGFDYFYGLPYSNDMHPSHPYNEKHNFPPLPLMSNENPIEKNPEQSGLTERYLQKSKEFITENKENPFLLYIAHMYVHIPIFPPAEFEKKSMNGVYGGAVEHLDYFMGQLENHIEDSSIADNTIVVFLSDNGAANLPEASNYPLRGYKGGIYEGGSKVPCFVYWKNHIKAGNSSDLISEIDLYPTLASLAGMPLNDGVERDGIDISNTLFGKKDGHKHLCYFAEGHLGAIRDDQWKLHLDTLELYNLVEDTSEEINVSNMHPEIVKKLQEEAKKYRDTLGDRKLGIKGKGCRPCGHVESPKTILPYEDSLLYTKWEYD